MATFKSTLEWYQTKIGDHDKQVWEQTVEGKILRNIESLPKRDFNHTEQNRELLDIDLIKGSTFTKAPPSHTSYIRTWKGLVRVMFLPIFYSWWIKHTTRKFFLIALVLYVAQISVTAVYFCWSIPASPTASLFEVSNPLLLMLVLSVMHTQIVYTQTSNKTLHYTNTSSANISTSDKTKHTPAGKRVKKCSSKLLKKRKPKGISNSESLSSNIGAHAILTTDSSEAGEETLDIQSGLIGLDDDDDGSVCSMKGADDHIWEGEAVPDVAADAAGFHAPLRHQVSRRPVDNREGIYTETGGIVTSDLDSDLDLENSSPRNWVRNSEVAESSSDTCSDYGTDEQREDAEEPFSLNNRKPHSLAYVPSCHDRITCIVWEKGQCKKVDLSFVELGGQIEQQVANIDYDSTELFICSVTFSFLISFFPFLFRFYYSAKLRSMLVALLLESSVPDSSMLIDSFTILAGSSWQEFVIIMNGVTQRFVLSGIFCFFVSVAERSYWQRLQFAKFFTYLTSARRSRKHGVPHFRLNKVKNIKIWLSLRAYLKKRGPQRSVEVIVGSVFGLFVVFLATMCVQLLADVEKFIKLYANWELTLCCLFLMCYLLRFYSLGTKITKKYRNLSTIITEQINLFLHMEQKPHKKEELLVANSVLKLAESLMKEIESPYKMSANIINPVVFNVARVAMLSAFSAVISELLGFKLKLHKVKM
ncbi:protein PHTF2-like [Watersipora subatra]|uniref:protein PHTF2-like n=1 Tax=Watersipora subatra TaxID=2589382 RepID=UPI00355C81CA